MLVATIPAKPMARLPGHSDPTDRLNATNRSVGRQPGATPPGRAVFAALLGDDDVDGGAVAEDEEGQLALGLAVLLVELLARFDGDPVELQDDVAGLEAERLAGAAARDPGDHDAVGDVGRDVV